MAERWLAKIETVTPITRVGMRRLQRACSAQQARAVKVYGEPRNAIIWFEPQDIAAPEGTAMSILANAQFLDADIVELRPHNRRKYVDQQ